MAWNRLSAVIAVAVVCLGCGLWGFLDPLSPRFVVAVSGILLGLGAAAAFVLLPAARAAVQALMEPDEAMVEAGDRVWVRGLPHNKRRAAILKAMLQTILEEK